MAKTYDASSKSLVTQFPEDIAALVGVTGVPVRELNSDSSDVIPVSGAVDGNLVVGTKKPFLLHVEFQAAHKAKLPKREYVHSAVLGHKYNMAVRTVIFYLHPEAWRRSQNGHYVIKDGFGWVCNQFNYQVVKVWTLKPNDLLKRVGTIPLAPLADITSDQLPALLTAIDRRLESGLTIFAGNPFDGRSFVYVTVFPNNSDKDVEMAANKDVDVELRVERFARAFEREFEQTRVNLARVVAQAESGHLIEQTERAIFDQMNALRNTIQKIGLQARIDEAEAAFSPSGAS